MIETTIYKQRLTEERDVLIKQLTELGIHNPEVSTDWIATPKDTETTEADENIVADRAEDWAERRAETGELEARLNNVNLALTKIEAGTYGVCEISGHAIETERLDANPAARTCKEHINEEANLTN